MTNRGAPANKLAVREVRDCLELWSKYQAQVVMEMTENTQRPTASKSNNLTFDV